MDAAPILFFDSGVGGLSIVAPARAALPTAPFVYAADSASFPYGTRTEDEIAARVPALLGRLVERYRPQMVVVACNTASTIALGSVRSALDLPVVGTVPAIRPAARLSKTRVIGVLGTESTVRQAYVDNLAARYAGDCRVIRHGSAALVTLAEAKLRGETVNPEPIADAVAPMLAAPGGDAIDVVVLACTHFPLLADELRVAMPRPAFVDGAEGIARRIVALTPDARWPAKMPPGVAVFTRCGAPERALAGALAMRGFPNLEQL